MSRIRVRGYFGWMAFRHKTTTDRGVDAWEF